MSTHDKYDIDPALPSSFRNTPPGSEREDRPIDSDSVHWADIVRVANLAEAGFLCDELSGIGIDARVHQLDEFSALHDRWLSQYLIRVPADESEKAAAHLRQYLFDDDAGGKPLLDVFRFSIGGRETAPLSWRPVAVVVLAGVAIVLLGQRFSEQIAPRRLPSNSLPSAVAAINKRFTTEPVANQPRYQLSFDERQQLWTLDTDRDHDGVFETSQHFSASGIAR